ncbi:MAG: HAMP domain-containing histidine kinase [Bacteroidales bacterium]|nr:HAMP domain-containing histidine kinase [Bacteroidales bacterium]
MSKLEAGVVKVKNEIVGVKKLVSNIIDSIRPLGIAANNKVVIVDKSHNEDDLLIVCDSIKLRQIIYNLVYNAVKFTKDGVVEVKYSRKGSNVLFEISDTGVGIHKDDIDHIFDRFYQSKHIPELASGSGLGLAIVKSYIEMLGGSIRVESEAGKGSCFYVELAGCYN